MSYREPMSMSKDRQIFRNTAVKSKLINVKPSSMRGGIRL